MSDRFLIIPTPLKGASVLERKPLKDQRGFFERLFCQSELHDFLQDKTILQINRTLTHKRGSIRGMHFQTGESSEIKFVSCLKGEVFDVIVDLRKDSKTFLQWHGEVLSESNHRTMFVPKGFAHGFQTLTDDCEMLYFHTAYYNQLAEGGLRFNDPQIDIKWPIEMTEMSDRDKAHPLLTEKFQGLNL